MLKKCTFESLIRLLNSIKETNIIDGDKIHLLNTLLDDIYKDNLTIRLEVFKFLKKHEFDYLNHIVKYNKNIFENMTFNYDELLMLIIPDFSTIRKKDEFSSIIKYIFEFIIPENNIQNSNTISIISDKLLNLICHFNKIFFTKIDKNHLTHYDITENLLLKHIDLHNHSEEFICFDDINNNTPTRLINLNNLEEDLKYYYDVLIDLTEFKQENKSIISNIYENLTNKDTNDLNIILKKLLFTVKLFFMNIIILQIFCFFKAITSSNNILDDMYEEKEKYKIEDNFNATLITNLITKESLEDISMNYFSLIDNDSFFYSFEASDTEKLLDKAKKVKNDSENDDESDNTNENDNKKASLFRKIKEKVSRVPIMMKTFSNKIRLYLQNKKSKWIFPRIRSKLDSMWERYASEAYVEENEFKDDPVLILKDKLCPDIIRIGKEVALLCNEVENLMKKASSMSKPEGVIDLANNWIKSGKLPDLTADGEKMDKLSLKRHIVLATRAKLVSIIMKNNDKIYGFSKNSAIVKALPPANHFIVSYFIANPQESPTKRDLTSIFKGPESFRIMATADKSDIFQISELMNAVLKNKLNAKTFDMIEEKRKEANEHMRGAFKDRDKNDEIQKEKEKKCKEALKGFRESLDVMFKQKLYVAELINIFGNMIIRVDKLCHKSMMSLLAVEAEKTDPRYRDKLGFGKGLQQTNKTSNIAENGK